MFSFEQDNSFNDSIGESAEIPDEDEGLFQLNDVADRVMH